MNEMRPCQIAIGTVVLTYVAVIIVRGVPDPPLVPSQVNGLYRVKNERELIGALGEPDAITEASRRVANTHTSPCFMYTGPRRWRIKRLKKPPFLTVARYTTKIRVYIVAINDTASRFQISRRLIWGPSTFEWAVVMDSLMCPTDRKECHYYIRDFINRQQQETASPYHRNRVTPSD